MKNVIYNFLLIGMILLTGLSLIGYLGGFHWLFDLFVHFKLQYLILLLIGFIGLYFLNWKKVFILFLIPILTNFVDVSSMYFGGNKDETITESLKICSVNLLSSNDEFDKLADLIQTEQPDILILQEFTAVWQTKMSASLAEYPFREEIPRSDNFGLAVYSKKPFDGTMRIDMGIRDEPTLLCKMDLANGPIVIVATHTPPPIGKMYSDQRNEQLDRLAFMTANKSIDYVILGDLNTSSYSSHFKNLLEKGRLRDSRRGLGIQASWPTWFPLAYTTLDHCLVTKNVVVKSRKIGQDIGSDHLPVIVEIGVRKHRPSF